MSRYVGIKDNNIYVVSDVLFRNDELNILPLPENLFETSAKDLINHYKYKNGEFKSKKIFKIAKDTKVAFVSNLNMQCGISTYAESLYKNLLDHVGDYKLFIEKNDNPTRPINTIIDHEISIDKIVQCWKRGESLKELVSNIKEYDPDVVIIQHEFGIFPNARYWLSLMNQLSEYRVIVTMHSVFHHRDKTICEAAMQEIIVHVEGAAKVLKEEKGVSGKVHVIPHGCYDFNNQRLWNYYKSNNTLIQVGFGFKYKAFENSIKACVLLKEKYKDIFLTVLFSEAPNNESDHQIYYNELMSIVNKNDMQENVAIIRGFQSDIVMDSFFRTNRVAVFPYQSQPGHIVYGASGAARLAMSANIPVITSTIPHFQDLPTIKADSVEDIAAALDHLYSDKSFYKNQLTKQEDFVKKYSWANIALEYVKIIEGST